MQLALNALIEIGDHVVTKVIEPEFVIGPVGDIRPVSFPSRTRSQV